jgi:hypothetical protein
VFTNARAFGTVWATATAAALKRYEGALAFCWLAHTDADWLVPETWLVDQLCLAETGVEAIAGTHRRR